MSMDNLWGMLEYLWTTKLEKDDWIILILNEHIEEDWIISLIREKIDLKDIPIKGKIFFVIIDAFGNEIEIIENWELTEFEIKKFLELVNLRKWIFDVRKGILQLYYNKDIMTETLVQFTKFLIKNRYGKN